MNNTIVTRARTNYSDAKARDLLGHVPGYNLSSTQVALFWSIFAFEHGAGADKNAPADGRAVWNCFNNDFGNRRGIYGDAGAFYMTAAEIIDGHEKPVGGIWPAYSTPEVGVSTWLDMMREHHHSAWLAAEGTTNTISAAVQMATAMKVSGYYTTSTQRYLAGLLTWLRIYQHQWPGK